MMYNQIKYHNKVGEIMTFKISGLDDLKKDLDGLLDKASKLEGEYDFDEILTPKFMKTHTKFDSIYDLFEANNVPVTTEELKAFPEDKLDEVIKNSTSFSSWEDMLDHAMGDFVDSKLSW